MRRALRRLRVIGDRPFRRAVASLLRAQRRRGRLSARQRSVLKAGLEEAESKRRWKHEKWVSPRLNRLLAERASK